MPSLDEEIKNASDEMEKAEDALVASGFSVEHWMLIKSYVADAIIHAQLNFTKEWQEKIASNLQGSSES
jgi:hypothetical protein